MWPNFRSFLRFVLFFWLKIPYWFTSNGFFKKPSFSYPTTCGLFTKCKWRHWGLRWERHKKERRGEAEQVRDREGQAGRSQGRWRDGAAGQPQAGAGGGTPWEPTPLFPVQLWPQDSVLLCPFHRRLKTCTEETGFPLPPWALTSGLLFPTLATYSLTRGPQTLPPLKTTATPANKSEKEDQVLLLPIGLRSLNFIQGKLILACSPKSYFWLFHFLLCVKNAIKVSACFCRSSLPVAFTMSP